MTAEEALAGRAGPHRGGEAPGFELRPGDVLVQRVAEPARRDGTPPADVDHCALAVDAREVVEALWPRVRLTPVEEFLARSVDGEGRPRVLVARPRAGLAHLAPAAVEAALGYLGRPYDDGYEPGDDALYCSELVVEAYREANGGRPVFETIDMTFLDPATGELPARWREHFARLGVPVPQGRPGSNPWALANSVAVDVVHRYGAVS